MKGSSDWIDEAARYLVSVGLLKKALGENSGCLYFLARKKDLRSSINGGLI